MTSPIFPDRSARRAFLRRAGQLSLAGVATPWALNLASMGEAAAATASDYKALVCVFLYGGNDHANTLVPVDGLHHGAYARLRSDLATPRDRLLATSLTPRVGLPDGLQLALAPQMSALKALFDRGRLAVQLNVGPLVVPTTPAQWRNRSVPLPPKLFSHNDQQSVWQSSQAEGATKGWGGRLGDLALSGNGNAMFSCISVTGNAVYLSGERAMQYQVSDSGPVPVWGARGWLFGSSACSTALRTLMTQSRTHSLENEYVRTTRRSLDAEALLSGALASGAPLTTVFPANNSLADQLKMVARMIAARQSLGVKRQVFMVSLGGFDLHDNLLSRHPALLGRLSDAMAAFHESTVELGVADNVTAFTASDFGRTLSSNGDGSDHGWGSHHFVLGGAVRGRQFYGTAPAIAVNGPDDVGQGRLVPTSSVDQYAATLATWFGVPAGDLARVVPNIGNFNSHDLGFMA